MDEELKKIWEDLLGGIAEIEKYGDQIAAIKAALEGNRPENVGNFEEKYNALRADYIKRFGEKQIEEKSNAEILSENYNEPDTEEELPDFGDLDFNAETE